MLQSIFSRGAAELSSTMLVIVSGGLTGHYASGGMNTVQWAGALVAILGSVTVAVAVRVWPAAARSQVRDKD